jgi:hypothetical protein
MLKSALFFLLFFCTVTGVRAATFTPTTTLDYAVTNSGITVNLSTGVISGGPGSGQITLRSAVIAANASSGSTINIPAGTYTLTIAGDDGDVDPNPTIGDLDVLASITIKGAGPSSTIIQAGTNPSNGIDQIFTFNAYYWSTGLSAVVNGFSGTARDLTFRYGRVVNENGESGSFVGGAISFDAGYNNGNPNTTPGSLYISNCVFDSCSGPYGAGAIQTFDGGTVTIDHCVFTNCFGFSNAGEGAEGGAICFGSSGKNGSYTVQNSSFLGCSAVGWGGAILFFQSNSLAIHNCIFSNNVATGEAGAIMCYGGGITIDQGSLFIKNFSGSGGSVSRAGALWIDSLTPSASISGCSFVSNTASLSASQQDGGGAIEVSTNATISNCRFFGNVANTGTGVHKDLNPGTVTAINNWWGNNNGPGTAGADSIVAVSPGVATSNPWLVLSFSDSPSTVLTSGTATLTASVTKNSSGTSGFSIPTGTPVTFAAGALGNASPASSTLTSGSATSTFTAGATGGTGQTSATVDNQTVTAAITVNQPAKITTGTNTTFVTGVTGSFTVTATGYPGPVLSHAGTLPSGVTFTPATGVLSGAPAAGTGQIYPLTFTATNTSGTNIQNFQLTVEQPPSLSCPATITTNAPGGVCLPAVAFASSVTGFPAPAVSYKLNSATIVSPYLFPIGTNVVTSTATNLIGTNTCSFDVKVSAGPAPQLSIAHVGTNAMVSWNASYDCYALQYSTALASNVWTAYPGPFATNGGLITVTKNSTTNLYFFRLSH